LSPDQTGEGRLYEAVLRIETPSVSQARALVSIISMVRSFMINGGPPPAGSPLALAAALFAMPPVQEGAVLIIRTGVMDEGEIALLFNMFAVYSN
jgi:hypothetical protein